MPVDNDTPTVSTDNDVPVEELEGDLALIESEELDKLPEPEDTSIPIDADTGEEDLEEKKEEKEKEEKEKEEKKEDKKLEEKGLLGNLKSEYPEIFKKFPEVRKAIFHEKEFLKLFASVEDAKDTKEKADDFDYLESSIQSGNLEPLLDSLKEAEHLESFSKAFLPALYNKSRGLYSDIMNPILHRLVRSMHNEGESTGNKNLKSSAWHVSKFIFGDPKYATEEIKGQSGSDPDRAKFEKEKQEYAERKYTDARNHVYSQLGSKMKDAVMPGLSSIKSEYFRNLANTDIQNQINEVLSKDQNHMSLMNGLWKKAHKADYSQDSLARIVSTYLARAKDLIPSVRAKVQGKFASDSPNGDTKKEQQTPVQGDRKAERTIRGPVDTKNVDWRKTSDLDLLSGKVTYKK